MHSERAGDQRVYKNSYNEDDLDLFSNAAKDCEFLRFPWHNPFNSELLSHINMCRAMIESWDEDLLLAVLIALFPNLTTFSSKWPPTQCNNYYTHLFDYLP